jgi:AraC-like DNA-binding protein
MTPLLVSSLALRARLGALETLGFDTSELCRKADIDESALANSQHFLPESSIWSIWREAFASCCDPALGLRAGSTVPFGAYGVLNYLSMSARTLGEGQAMLSRYWPLIGTGRRVEIASRQGGPHALRYIPYTPAAGVGLHCRDYTVAAMTKQLYERSGLRPVAVELAGEPSAPLALYEEILGTRVSFGQAYTALIFSDREWNAELPGSDARLFRVLEDYATKLVEHLPRNQGVGARAAREIASRLRQHDLGLRVVARSLALSERTLQRHLSQEGYTFEGLVDRVRREHASELLKEVSLSITEIAYLVGYSGPAAFHRAFKRWTGSSPRRATRETH